VVSFSPDGFFDRRSRHHQPACDCHFADYDFAAYPGTKGSASVNNIIVILKMTIVISSSPTGLAIYESGKSYTLSDFCKPPDVVTVPLTPPRICLSYTNIRISEPWLGRCLAGAGVFFAFIGLMP
jgi:hypothetical protein